MIPSPVERRDKRRKLTDEQYAEIRRRYPKETQKALAAEYGVCVMTIQNIVKPSLYERQRAAASRSQMERYNGSPEYRQHRIEASRAWRLSQQAEE